MKSAANCRAIISPIWSTCFAIWPERFDGAYNIVFLNALGEMVVLRDPLGLRPLCYAKEGQLFAAASESVALLNLGFQADNIKSLLPGQLVVLSPERYELHTFGRSAKRAHCFFEWIYFANVASTMDERSVYLTRKNLGEELARLETVPIDADTIVVPVPDTSKAAADAMAYKLRVPSLEGLIRNRYTRPDVYRRHRQSSSKSRNEIHAAARSAGRQTCAAGGRFDCAFHHDESADQSHPRIRRREGNSRARGLPADYRAVFLRHRHVDDRRTVRPAVSARWKIDRGSSSAKWRKNSAPIRCATCRWNRSRGQSVSTTINSAGRASPANIPRRTGKNSIKLPCKTATPAVGGHMNQRRQSPRR